MKKNIKKINNFKCELIELNPEAKNTEFILQNLKKLLTEHTLTVSDRLFIAYILDLKKYFILFKKDSDPIEKHIYTSELNPILYFLDLEYEWLNFIKENINGTI